MDRTRTVSRPAVAAGIAFLVLASGFNVLDLYPNLFYSLNRFDHVSYNAARVLAATFVLLVQFALGQGPLNLLRRRGAEFLLAPQEEIAISILCGSAVMRVAMLVLGFAGCYFWWVIAVGGAVSALLGWDRYARLWGSVAKDGFQALRAGNWFERVALVVMSATLVLAVAEVVAEKLILPNGPSGTVDFYTHYYPYMQHVVAARNIWPNDVWYHFYVSKALGEGFFSILATDALGVQVASCAMFFAGVLLVFCFVKRAGADALIAIAAAAVTASGLIWTASPAFGAWGDFSKEHVITATLWFGCVWACWRARSISAKDLSGWSILVGIALCGLIIVRIEFAAVAIIFLAAMAAWAGVSQRRDLVVAYLAQIGLVVVFAVLVLGMNYAVTGLAELTPFRLFWGLADQQKFARWVSPFLMLLLQLGSSSSMGALAAHSLPSPEQLATLLRFERAAPFMGPWGATFVVVLGLSAIALVARTARISRELLSAAAALLLMLVASAAAFVVNDQIVTMYRLYVFCVFPVAALAALPFAAARAAVPGRVAAAIALVAAIQVFAAVRGETARVQNQRLVEQFAVGNVSIADAFVAEGALWPDGLAMSRVAGGAPIWSSDIFNACAAPECNFETFFSYSMGPEWATITFGPADAAEAALQRAGLNYFAINTTRAFFDTLPYAPLFSPAEMKRRFGVVWEGDGAYLLTWRSAATTPIPEAFFPAYAESKKLALSNADFAAIYADLDVVYRSWQNAGRKFPVRLDPNTPMPRGWQ